MKPVVDGHIVQEFSLKTRQINEPGKISIRANSVTLWNTGTNTVILDNVFEIPAGASFQFGDNNLLNMIVQEFNVKFSGAGTDKLQIAEVIVNDRRLAHYVERPTAK
jgi:hypothetical protein